MKLNNLRRYPGIKGKRPDKKQARRDVVLLNAQKRGDQAERIAKLYLPAKA
jgi:hypothetical protein